MKVSKLFEEMCKFDRWQNLLDHATEKEIDLATIERLLDYGMRKSVLDIILRNEYSIIPPHIARIPKDEKGKFREVYVNEPLDRIILTLINDILCDLFADMVHPCCKSYQKGIGTQKVVKEISHEITRLGQITNGRTGWKADFSKYFDNVAIEVIDNVFDTIEKRLGFEKDTEPVINLLRRYYHQDWYLDLDKKLQRRYQGLKQGCSVASFLANVCLYELDDYMSRHYKIYYRYSDDFVVIDKNTDNVIDETNAIISKYGVSLNPKKVEPLYSDKWFKFLGFNIKGDMITLSKTRLKKFQEEIEVRTINRVNQKQRVTFNSARKSVINYLYYGEYNFATACLGVINVAEDLDTMDNFIKDCLRSCEIWEKERKVKTNLGGLGSAINLKEKTILRGKGKHVKYLRAHTGKYLDNYLTMKCLSNNLKIHKTLFETTVRNMK